MRYALAIVLALAACKRPEAKTRKAPSTAGDSWGSTRDAGVDELDVVPAGSLVEDTFVVYYAVILPARPTAAQHDAIVASARAHGFAIGGAGPARWIEVTDGSREDVVTDLGRISWQIPPDEAALRDAAGSITIAAGAAIGELDAAHDALVAVLSDAGGLIIDLQSEAAYDAAAIAALRGRGRDAHELIQVFRDPEGAEGTQVLTTGGMLRFGLPELRVRHVPLGMSDEVLIAIDATAQTLVDRGALSRAGALEVDVAALPGMTDTLASIHDHGGTGRITWRATWAGDADVDTIELAPIGAGDVTARLGVALDALFGIEGISTVEFDPASEETQAITARAHAELSALRGRFVGGVPADEHLRVLAPFAYLGDQKYWLWVEVTRWKTAPLLRGTVIETPPEGVEVRLGDHVEIAFDDILDYAHRRADGTTAGPLQPFSQDD